MRLPKHSINNHSKSLQFFLFSGTVRTLSLPDPEVIHTIVHMRSLLLLVAVVLLACSGCEESGGDPGEKTAPPAEESAADGSGGGSSSESTTTTITGEGGGETSTAGGGSATTSTDSGTDSTNKDIAGVWFRASAGCGDVVFPAIITQDGGTFTVANQIKGKAPTVTATGTISGADLTVKTKPEYTPYDCTGTAENGWLGAMDLSCISGKTSCTVSLTANLNGYYEFDGAHNCPSDYPPPTHLSVVHTKEKITVTIGSKKGDDVKYSGTVGGYLNAPIELTSETDSKMQLLGLVTIANAGQGGTTRQRFYLGFPADVSECVTSFRK
jgi:hypothetical protein